MGFHLVDRAMHAATQHRLRERDALVLIGMAHRARDTGKDAQIYHHGWRWIARACLGYLVYDDAAKRGVARSIRRLNELGLLKTLQEPRPGQATVYHLNLPPSLEQPGWWITDDRPPEDW